MTTDDEEFRARWRMRQEQYRQLLDAWRTYPAPGDEDPGAATRGRARMMPYYWCHATDDDDDIWHSVEAGSSEDAVRRFWEFNECLPDTIDGRAVWAYCTECEAVVFEREYYHRDADGERVLCLKCLTGYRQ